MARDHARIRVDIWAKDDWKLLTITQQLVYLALTTSPDLSYCGVLPLIPTRYVDLNTDMTERRFTSAISVLELRKYVVTDTASAELLVRSYIRHDGILKQPNVTKAMVTALKRVHSRKITRAIEAEIVRLMLDEPDAKGWRGFADVDPEGFTELMTKAHRKGSGKGSPKGSGNPKATPFPLSPFPNYSSSSPTYREGGRR